MALDAKMIKRLGLKSTEVKVISVLQKAGQLNISEVARITRLPRATVTFTVNRLHDRELLAKVTVGKRFEWVLGDGLFVESRDNPTKVFKGTRQLVYAHQKIAQLAKGGRFYFIQGNKNARLVLNNFTSKEIGELHILQKKNDVVIEGVIGEKVLRFFEELDDKELESHFGRMTVAYVVPDKYIDFSADVVIVGDYIFMFDYDKKLVWEIKDGNLSYSWLTLLGFLETNAKKVNLNSHIQEILGKRKLF